MKTENKILRSCLRSCMLLLILAALAVITFFVLTSPFMLRTIWIPYAASKANLSITLEEAELGFALSGTTLYAKNVQIEDSDRNTFHIRDGECKFRFWNLLAGIFEIDSLSLEHVEGNVRKPPSSSMIDKTPTPDDIHLGACDIRDFRLHVSSKFFPNMDTVSVSRMHLTGLLPGRNNQLSASCCLHFKNHAELPLSMELNITPASGTFFMPELTGHLEASPGRGSICGRNLELVMGKAFFELKSPDAASKANWKINLDLEGVDCLEKAHVTGSGFLDAKRLMTRGEFRVNSEFSRVDLCKLYLPFDTAAELLPDHIQASNSHWVFEWSNAVLSWQTQNNLKWDRITVAGKQVIGSGAMTIHQSGNHDFLNNTTTFRNFHLQFQAGESKLACDTGKNFALTKKPDGALQWQDGGQPLTIHAENMPSELLNPFIPASLEKGLFSVDITLLSDLQKQQLHGHFMLQANSLAIAMEEKRFWEPCNAAVEIKMHSEGLSHIRELAVDSCNITVSNKQRPFLLGNLKGKFHFDKELTLALFGKLDTLTCDIFSQIRDPLAEKIVEKLKKHHAQDMKNRYEASLTWDPGQKNMVTYSLKTSFNTLSLFGDKFAGNPLSFEIAGDASRTADEQGVLRINQARLSARELLDMQGTGKISFPDGKLDMELKLNQLSDELWKGTAELLWPGLIPERELKRFYYASLNGNMMFSLSPLDRSIRIRQMSIRLVPKEKQGNAVLTLDKPYLFSYENPAGSECRLTLIFRHFPLLWFNVFMPPDTLYEFRDGIANATMEVLAKDLFRHIFFNVDVMGENYQFNTGETMWNIGDAHIDGTMGLIDNCRSITFRNMRFVCTQDTKFYAEGECNGQIGVWDKAPTDLNFKIIRTGPYLPHLLLGSALESLETEDFEGNIDFFFKAEDTYDNCDLGGHAVFSKWLLKNAPKKMPVHGSASFNVDVRPKFIRFRDCGLQADGPQKQKILHFLFNNTIPLTQPDAERAISISSDGMDLAFFIHSVFFSNEPPPPPQPSQKFVPSITAGLSLSRTQEEREKDAPWPFREKDEPAPSDLFKDPAKLTLDLKNIRCTSHLQGTIHGTLTAEKNTLKTSDITLKINDAPASVKWQLDLSKPDGYEYDAAWSIQNFDASKLLLAIAELKKQHFTGDDLQGIIKSLNMEVKGKGFSLQNLDRNLKLKSSAEIENLSVPFDARTYSILLRIILMPLEQIPRLIRTISNEKIRDFLLALVGENMEILTGQRNIVFDSGKIELESDKTDIHIKKMYFLGPKFRFRVEQGSFNPFYNEINVDSLSKFASILYPIRFYGSLDDPDYDTSYFLTHFFQKNTFSNLNDAVNKISFGLIGDTEAEWIKPADDSRSNILQKIKNVNSNKEKTP